MILYWTILEQVRLDNIQWKNTIAEPEEKIFNIVLGNPPYFKLDNESLKEIKGYEAVKCTRSYIESFCYAIMN